MKYSKQEIENRLKEMLNEMLSDYNQDGTLISLDFDSESETATIKMNVYIDEDYDYVGFATF